MTTLKEKSVFELVKKYPLYSVDKLAQALPGISRHSIQTILEKQGLSTVAKRLEFAGNELAAAVRVEPVEKKQAGTEKPVLRWLGWLKLGRNKTKVDGEVMPGVFNKEGRRRTGWRVDRVKLGLAAGLVALVGGGWLSYGYLFAPVPRISLEEPGIDFIGQSERLFVSGWVNPVSSRVTVNGETVYLNGDGSFTAIIEIPLGESVLTLEAGSRGKKSRLVRLVEREASEAEYQRQESEEELKRKEALSREAQLDTKIKDLLAVKSSGTGESRPGLLRIVEGRLKEENGAAQVVGEVVNLGQEEASWVTVTAKFFDGADSLVDEKVGFATDFGQTIKPGEKAAFETQMTRVEFDHYTLDLSWEGLEGLVAGVASESALIASDSAQESGGE